MSNSSDDVRFYWPGVSGYESDGSISIRVTGSERDCRFTGGHKSKPSDPDFAFWAWIHEHRCHWPVFFDNYYLPALETMHRGSGALFSTPDDGIYCITASWSGPAVAIETAIRSAITERPLPVPVQFIDTDSPQIETLFPQFRPFLNGWGELFVIRHQRCDLFMAPGRYPDTIDQSVAALYDHYE